MSTSHAATVRRAGIALIAGALITAIGGVVSQFVQASTTVSDDLWRYPWSSDAFVPVSVLWAAAHVLVIIGLLGFRRSALAGDSTAARRGITLAIAGTALLLVGEIASLPMTDEATNSTAGGIVGAVFGLGVLLSAVGLLLAGKATLSARRWQDWRRFTPITAGAWTLALVGIAMTKGMPTGVAIYGLCLLALGIALYSRPAVATSGIGRTHSRAVSNA